MTAPTEESTTPQAIPALLTTLQLDDPAAEEALRLALEEPGTVPLLDWARQRGAYHSEQGHDLQSVIAEATSIAQSLSELRPEANLLVPIVSAATEGYLEAQGKHTETLSERELRDRVAELTALHRINSAANSSLNLGDMLHETVQAVVAVTHADICSIYLYEAEWDQLVLTATSGLSRDAVGRVRLRLGEGIAGWAAMAGKPIAVRNAWDHPRFKYVPTLGEERAVSTLVIPVVLFTKEKLVGVIVVNTYEERSFTDNEIKFLETVAGEIAIAIENARLYEQTDAKLRQKVAELSTLQGVSAHIAATLNLSEVLTLIAYQAAHLVYADAATIYEVHPGTDTLNLVAQYDLQDPKHSIHQAKAVPTLALDMQSSGLARAIMTGIPSQLSPGTDADLGVPFAHGDYQSMFCVPLVAPRGIMGGICLYNVTPKVFNEDEVRLLDAFAHEAAIALENSRLYDAALRGLRTKSTMLQEMNHRVRNNLQTVAGLLSMQLRRMAPQGEAATAVRESISRIQSMAAVHDLMVSGDTDVQSITIYEVARKVVEAAVSTLLSPAFKLDLQIDPVEADSIRVGSHEATLLALLFNELASNAILHGFAGREQGRLTLRAWTSRGLGDTPTTEGVTKVPRTCEVTIEVANDGTGLPEDFDPEKSANLGLNIVRTLVNSDLRGKFKIAPGGDGSGVVTTITFTPTQQTTLPVPTNP
ncbi:MAG: GAF domain-containing protein [Chloroflexota bacterium]|nr:GAF domain-containing protein [Chloroflexota bacterium]